MTDIGAGPIPITWDRPRLMAVRITVTGITDYGLIDGPRTLEVPIPQPDDHQDLAEGLAKRVEETLMQIFQGARIA